MSSSHAVTTCQMIARGLNYDQGSIQEACARVALENERRASFLTTLALVNAIIETGNRIAAAVTSSPTDQLKGDTVKKALDALRTILLPEDEEAKEQQAIKARKKLEEEVSRGPIQFKPMSYTNKKPRNR